MALSDAAAPLEAKLDQLSGRLATCREAIARGERVELKGLDSEMNELCVSLVDQRPESKRYLPRLETLIDELNGLEADLTRQFEFP